MLEASTAATMNPLIHNSTTNTNGLYNPYNTSMKDCLFPGELPSLVFTSVYSRDRQWSHTHRLKLLAAANTFLPQEPLRLSPANSYDQEDLIFPMEDEKINHSMRNSSSPVQQLSLTSTHSQTTSTSKMKSSLRKVKSENICLISSLKKNVSFADQNGGQLEFIKLIKTVSPHSDPSPHKQSQKTVESGEIQENLASAWEPGCIQPAAQYISFREKLENQLVSLENLRVDKPEDAHKISGSIKVRNVSFWKEVFLRVTFDNWSTFSDISATYQPCTDQHPRFDTFIFTFTIPNRLISTCESHIETEHSNDKKCQTSNDFNRIECVICYRCDRGEFWDNNAGKNYVLKKKFPSSTTFTSSHATVFSSVQSLLLNTTLSSSDLKCVGSSVTIRRTSHTEYRAWSTCANESRYY